MTGRTGLTRFPREQLLQHIFQNRGMRVLVEKSEAPGASLSGAQLSLCGGQQASPPPSPRQPPFHSLFLSVTFFFFSFKDSTYK